MSANIASKFKNKPTVIKLFFTVILHLYIVKVSALEEYTLYSTQIVANQVQAPLVLNDTPKVQTLKNAIENSSPREKLAVAELYKLSWYELIWQRHPEQVTIALKLLNTASYQGLKAEDYKIHQLNRQWQQLHVSLAQASYKQLVDFDLALSNAFMAYVFDLNYGRINPKKVKFDFKQNKEPLKIAQNFLNSINNNGLAKFIQQQTPNLVFYKNLQKALRGYQTAAQKKSPKFKFPNNLASGATHKQLPQLKKLLIDLGDLTAKSEVSTKFTPALAKALKHFQQRHRIKSTSKLDRRTQKELNTPLSKRIQQIEMGLERLRWIPRYTENRLIFVNIPSFRLWAFNDLANKNTEFMSMRVVVGKAKKHPTPVFSTKMHYLAFRPYWYLPQSIIRNEIGSRASSSSYLRSRNMEIVKSSDKRLRIRQKPGIKNALGLVKFIFPNKYAVYLHDTPSKSLFKRTRRDFSHGCIRVSEPANLAIFALGQQNSTWNKDRVKKAMNKGGNRRVSLETKIPVVLFYSTVMAMEDGVYFLADIYNYDAKLKRKLGI